MFKNEYQGGAFFEVFSTQGKDHAAHWKITASSIKRGFDREVKSYVYFLEGSTMSAKMQFPGDSKYSALSLIQRYLVLQVFVPKGHEFSIDLGVTDVANNKRRIALSTTQKEPHVTLLHCKIPISLIRRSKWLNLCVDVHSLLSETWKGETFKSLDSISVTATCRLRRIFTMKAQAPDTTDDDELYNLPSYSPTVDYDHVPKQYQFGLDVPNVTQLINMMKVLYSVGMAKKYLAETDIDLNSSGGKKSLQDPYHIAFGTKMAGGNSTRSRDHRDSTGANTTLSASSSAGSSRAGRGDRSTRGDIKEPQTSRSKERESRGNNSCRRDSSHGRRRDSTSGSRASAEASRGNAASKRQQQQHTRNKSDSSSGVCPPRPERPPPDPHRKLPTPRDRRDSDPCYNDNPDPELAVDKESLRTSHTWTDGADGTEPIPFVKVAAPVQPHPPSQPSSSQRARRKPRVKSAGSRDRGANSSKDDITGSVSSVTTSATSSNQSSRANSGTVREYHSNPAAAIATPEDVMNVMRKVVASANSRTASESEPTSHNTSVSGGGGDDSMTDLIHTLNQPDRLRAEDEEDGRAEDSDDEEEEDRARLYQYSSPPKSASDGKKGNAQASNQKGTRARKNNTRPHRTRMRKKSDDRTSHKATPTIELPPNSSEDEEMRTSHTNHKRHNSNRRRSDEEGGKRNSGSYDSGFGNGAGGGGGGGGRLPDLHLAAITPSPVNSQSRMSISKKSLREIPQNDLRLSGGSKPYVPANYQMADLSDSFEARLLLSLKKEVQAEDESSDGGHGNRRNLSQYKYGEDDLTDSSDDMSTLKGPPNLKGGTHNYQDEMLGNEYLTQSNPRVFSPPIVLPGTSPHSLTNITNISPRNNDSKFSQYKRAPQIHPPFHEAKQETDEEDELDLLYDQVLNCYFDPKTNKYYELV